MQSSSQVLNQKESETTDPLPTNAITKGSFSAWTEPPKPRPFQEYTIVIQVKLPSKVSGYSVHDLEGFVQGTDGFYRQIGAFDPINQMVELSKFHSRFKVGGNSAKLMVTIPGARSMIKDSITIRSLLLKESQNIMIEFGAL